MTLSKINSHRRGGRRSISKLHKFTDTGNNNFWGNLFRANAENANFQSQKPLETKDWWVEIMIGGRKKFCFQNCSRNCSSTILLSGGNCYQGFLLPNQSWLGSSNQLNVPFGQIYEFHTRIIFWQGHSQNYKMTHSYFSCTHTYGQLYHQRSQMWFWSWANSLDPPTECNLSQNIKRIQRRRSDFKTRIGIPQMWN